MFLSRTCKALLRGRCLPPGEEMWCGMLHARSAKFYFMYVLTRTLANTLCSTSYPAPRSQNVPRTAHPPKLFNQLLYILLHISHHNLTELNKSQLQLILTKHMPLYCHFLASYLVKYTSN